MNPNRPGSVAERSGSATRPDVHPRSEPRRLRRGAGDAREILDDAPEDEASQLLDDVQMASAEGDAVMTAVMTAVRTGLRGLTVVEPMAAFIGI